MVLIAWFLMKLTTILFLYLGFLYESLYHFFSFSSEMLTFTCLFVCLFVQFFLCCFLFVFVLSQSLRCFGAVFEVLFTPFYISPWIVISTQSSLLLNPLLSFIFNTVCRHYSSGWRPCDSKCLRYSSIIIIIIPWEFFTSELADGLSLEYE